MKAAPVGLFGRGHLPPKALRSAFAGQWIQAAWRDLEPHPGVYDFSILDQQRAAMLLAMPDSVARYRIFAGTMAPDYVKQQSGVYQATDATVGAAPDVVVWWHPYTQLHYSLLMGALAVHVEDDPVVVEVAASLTMARFAEPLIRDMASRATRTSMLAAGYTYELDKDAVQTMLDIHEALFLSTHTGLAFNPVQDVEVNLQSLSDTIALMDNARAMFGERLVLENNSLDAKPGSTLYAAMYAHMQILGKPLGFQTRAPMRLPDPAGAISHGISLGATCLEPNGTDLHTLNAARAVQAALQANADA